MSTSQTPDKSNNDTVDTDDAERTKGLTEDEIRDRFTGAGEDRPEEPQGEVWRINENSA
ncbi:MAG: hypothetical protein HKN36_04125 [Hellea sp.]|nr:hypothetical protein [Hellea sp.]